MPRRLLFCESAGPLDSLPPLCTAPAALPPGAAWVSTRPIISVHRTCGQAFPAQSLAIDRDRTEGGWHLQPYAFLPGACAVHGPAFNSLLPFLLRAAFKGPLQGAGNAWEEE